MHALGHVIMSEQLGVWMDIEYQLVVCAYLRSANDYMDIGVLATDAG